jgi:monofunctional biosynthetic peptidoglycan transglycosylase
MNEPVRSGEPPPPPRRRQRRWPWLALAGLGLAWIAWEAVTWPRVGRLRDHNPTTTREIELHARRTGQRPPPLRWASWSRLSPHLKRAVLVGEDINFFHHDGFDRAEIRKALEEAWEEREIPRGASTITQQLARNLWLSPSRDPWRKVKEALLTRELEARLGKRRILEIYLNVVEFGPGVYGAEAAARRWFGKPAADLDEREAAQLAAGLPRPSSWHPGSTSRAYARRVERLLARMDKAAFLRREIER